MLVALLFTAAIVGQYAVTFVFKDHQNLEISILKSDVAELNVLVEELNTTTYEEIQSLNTSLTEDVNNLNVLVTGLNDTLMGKIVQGDLLLQRSN